MTARKRRDEASQRRKQSMVREQQRKDRLRDGRFRVLRRDSGCQKLDACVIWHLVEQRQRRHSNGRRSRTSTSPSLGSNWTVRQPSSDLDLDFPHWHVLTALPLEGPQPRLEPSWFIGGRSVCRRGRHPDCKTRPSTHLQHCHATRPADARASPRSQPCHGTSCLATATAVAIATAGQRWRAVLRHEPAH